MWLFDRDGFTVAIQFLLMNFLILTVGYIIIIEFMKKKKKEDGSSFEEGMLKLLRTLPKVLKFLPSDKAKDARNFMMSFQYWLGGTY